MKNIAISLFIAFALAFNACQSTTSYDRVLDESELPQSIRDKIKASQDALNATSNENANNTSAQENSQNAATNTHASQNAATPSATDTQNAANKAATATPSTAQNANQATNDTQNSAQNSQNSQQNFPQNHQNSQNLPQNSQAQQQAQSKLPPGFDPFAEDDEKDEITPMDYDPYEFLGKIVIKLEEPDNFELIDLKQRGIKREKPVFDSSKEIAKNNIYLRYEDTEQDLVLIAGYNDGLLTELGVSTSGEGFVTKVFERFIEGANGDKSVQLLNFQHNVLYETPKNFAALTKDPHNKQLSVSAMLGFETSFNRMYLKSPEYLLFIIVDECYFKDVKRLWWSNEFVRVNFTYKIVRLSDKVLVKSEKLGFSFEMPSEVKKAEKYDYIALQVGDELKAFFPEILAGLKTARFGKH